MKAPRTRTAHLILCTLTAFALMAVRLVPSVDALDSGGALKEW